MLLGRSGQDGLTLVIIHWLRLSGCFHGLLMLLWRGLLLMLLLIRGIALDHLFSVTVIPTLVHLAFKDPNPFFKCHSGSSFSFKFILDFIEILFILQKKFLTSIN